MKLLILAPYVGATYGGTSKAVLDVAQAIAQTGVQVDLITTNANGTETLTVPLNTWITQAGYRLRYFSCWHRHDLILSPILLSWLYQNARHYDIVHSHTLFSPLISLALCVCRRQEIPYLVTPHGMLEPWALAHKSAKKRLYYRWVEQENLVCASAIQALTPAESKQITGLGQLQSIVVPNGIHFQPFTSEFEPSLFYQSFPTLVGKTLILFLGRIDPKKGLDLLASAFAQVRDNFPKAHLVIAGPDHSGFATTVRAMLESTNCLNAVTFTGMVTGKLKYAALAAADIYVAPSYSEGFSLSVLEGMAAGLPCIITTGCNFPEAAAAEAAYVVPTQSEAIAQLLTQCLSQPDVAKGVGDRARQFIFENYTWDQAAQKLIREYQRILGSSQMSAKA